ncbi:MAG TPA: capsule assembly Wzi family protein, partial [Deferrisomatales bacterium]|nr:capsule assembly Wzi family protein [Deferrisomatales bacterium]
QGVVRAGDLDYRTKRLYLKGVWGKWSLKIGRDSERLGPGYHGSLLLDDNAPTMDLVRIRTEEPLFLPGKLASLGGFRFMVFNATLNDDNPSPPDPRYGGGAGAIQNPYLLAMRFSYHPTSWLDLGLSRAILYGGRGRETYDTPRDYWELFTATNENVFKGESQRYDNDQYAAMDATVRFPGLNGVGPLKGGKVYYETGGTDLFASWQGDQTGILPIQFANRAHLAGGYLTTAVTDFRAEYAIAGPSWYQHHQYPQGYSFRGRPLGHFMGPDAFSYYFEIGRHLGPDWRLSGGFDYQKRGRSLARTETRKEGSLWLENRDLELWGRPLSVRVDYLLAHVRDPLDDLEASERTETYLGVTVRIPL